MYCIRLRRLEQLVLALLILTLIMLLVGCDQLGDWLGSQRATRVEVTNNGEFPVEAVFFLDDEQDIPGELLEEIGERIELTIEPGETVPFTRDCDDLQAIVLDAADLRVVGAVGPETSSDVLRDGTDFNCRDTITFTFEHSDVLVDFDVVTGRETN